MISIANNHKSRSCMASFFALIVCGCASFAGQESQSTEIGLGVNKFTGLAQNIIADMRGFFSSQTIYDNSGTCPVRIMINPQRFDNESSERVNFDLITQGFRSHFSNLDNEKKLSLTGQKIAFLDTDRKIIAGHMPPPQCVRTKSGADYLLAGRIISDDKIDRNDVRQRQTLITFWLLDLETGAKAWSSPPYVFKSYGQNDAIYR